MNELLAIILIVLLCCCLFFAWLFALATCPDRMVNLISGAKQSSSPISRASEDLLGQEENGQCPGQPEKGAKKGGGTASGQGQARQAPLLVRSRSIPSNRSNGLLGQLNAEKRSNSKKLSVVPEADEQLTVTSMSQCVRPGAPSKAGIKSGIETGASDPLLAVKTVLLQRNASDCSARRKPEEMENPGRVEEAEEVDEEEERGEEADDQQEEDTQAEVLTRRSAPPAVQIIRDEGGANC